MFSTFSFYNFSFIFRKCFISLNKANTFGFFYSLEIIENHDIALFLFFLINQGHDINHAIIFELYGIKNISNMFSISNTFFRFC